MNGLTITLGMPIIYWSALIIQQENVVVKARRVVKLKTT